MIKDSPILSYKLNNRVLIYRSPLRKLDTSSNQLCASLDKVCASGKLLSFSVAGTGTGCGQSTASVGCLLAHPPNITSKNTNASKSGITLLPSHHKGLSLLLFVSTIFLLHDSRPLGIISAHFLDVFCVQSRRVLVASNKKGGTRYKYRHIFQDKAIHCPSIP